MTVVGIATITTICLTFETYRINALMLPTIAKTTNKCISTLTNKQHETKS